MEQKNQLNPSTKSSAPDKANNTRNRKYCVYTVLTGNYEKLNEQPVSKESGIDFLCFTDNKDLKSETWKIVPFEPVFPQDLHRSSRTIKICPHRYLENYDTSLYIDNSVKLLLPPEQIFKELLPEGIDLVCIRHSFRNTLMDEFSEVLKLNLDDPGRVLEQLSSYQNVDPKILSAGVFAGGFLIRNHNQESVISAMEDWLAQVYRYSRRDQLSLSYILQTHTLNYQALNLDLHNSKYHQWPTVERVGQWQFSQPDLSLVRDLQELPGQNSLTIGQITGLKPHSIIEETIPEGIARKLADAEFELNEIKTSKSWKLAMNLRKFRLKLIPKDSFREKVGRFVWARINWKRKDRLDQGRKREFLDLTQDDIDQINKPKPDLVSHKEKVDIIICIHNALIDVQNCLDSVKVHTSQPYSLILVDDGSDSQTEAFLKEFVGENKNSVLIRNDSALGYTRAANQGMKQSNAPFLLLLNSDTIVGPHWLDRMCLVMNFNSRNGVVGPLSNTASWQSIPKLENKGDWAMNPLPDGISIDAMSSLVEKYSGKLWHEVPLLNGFCMLIRREVIDDIGYFDELNFGEGYGEEDDFILRARAHGWKAIVADDVYIYHAQSKSYSNETRKRLAAQNGQRLVKKHGAQTIEKHVDSLRYNRVFEGIRNRTSVMFERERIVEEGEQIFQGKSLLFVLPIIDTGGGGNVVINEARCMRKMGVDAKIFNLKNYKAGFLRSYPNLDIPVIFGTVNDLNKIGSDFNAVVATANRSVEWLKRLEGNQNIELGYYVQDFEPLFYSPDSTEYKKALDSYGQIRRMKYFTKTDWTKETVLRKTGIFSKKVGISVDIDLFRPLSMLEIGKKPVTIAAMVRPHSVYRAPLKTTSVLKKIKNRFGNDVNIWFYGSNNITEVVADEFLDFEWKQFGKLTQNQVAALFSNVDVFVDFSSHQAMGLSALEAMACGCSVVVPKFGGASEFVFDRKNGLVVDTSSEDACISSLEKLIEDDQLRKTMQMNAMHDVCKYFPESAAFNTLKYLLNNE